MHNYSHATTESLQIFNGSTIFKMMFYVIFKSPKIQINKWS